MTQYDDTVAALATKESWTLYQEDKLKKCDRIDLSFVSLSDSNFKSYVFRSCTFRSSIIRQSDMDETLFIDCQFIGCIFEDLSFVMTKIQNCIFRSCSVRKVFFRNATIDGVACQQFKIKNLSVKGSRISNLEIDGSSFETVEINSSSCDVVTVSNSTISLSCCYLLTCRSAVLRNVQFRTCEYSNVDIFDLYSSNVYFVDSQLDYLSVWDSKIVYPKLENTLVGNCSFISSMIFGAELSHFNLPSTKFLNVYLVDCEWPNQRYSISLSGSYCPPLSLLGQPVEDIKGIPTRLRSEILESQLIDSLFSESNSTTRRIILRLWGMFSGFGRSVQRLTGFCILMIVLLSSAYWICFPRIDLLSSPFGCLLASLRVVGANFVGLGNLGSSTTLHHYIILVVTRLIGIVFLGLWLGVASNKLGSIGR